MRLSKMLTAIREYPALKVKYEAMREQQASQERTAVQLSIAYNIIICKSVTGICPKRTKHWKQPL